jgi:hypothetical protein
MISQILCKGTNKREENQKKVRFSFGFSSENPFDEAKGKRAKHIIRSQHSVAGRQRKPSHY